jgi:anti-anti-sigma regulatory factor
MESGQISAQMQQVMADHPLPWSVYGLNGTLLCTNPPIGQLFGPQITAMLGQYNVLEDPATLGNGLAQAVRQAVEGQRSTLPANLYNLGDTEVWYESTVFPNHAADGTVASVSILLQDVTGKKRAEQELLRRTEEIIQAQQAALRELSTPLIPLADHVVVMPLVGSIDSQRAQLIMETLLEGISTYQADVAILDITGVPVVDTQVADALLRTARAARLLGAQVVLTGIGSHIAQTLITVGADLSGLVTLNNLQSGISYALRVAGAPIEGLSGGAFE